MKKSTHSYIAICPKCNGWVMAISDLAEEKIFTSKEITKYVKAGYIIERILSKDFNINNECRCNKKPKQETLL